MTGWDVDPAGVYSVLSKAGTAAKSMSDTGTAMQGNEYLERFIRTYLQFEVAYDDVGYLRSTLFAFKESFARQVEEGLAEVVRTRSISVGEYERLTGVEFPDEESLYAYLEAMYGYLFEGGVQPVPPA
ncbi:DUF6507 family protein [Streptomyces sp. NPDC048208]|uniref:DUF6507 family protein n=1 Tax=Streptomyces sp. NPDC048208 TaxID=3365515 RepID=UPI003716B8F6